MHPTHSTPDATPHSSSSARPLVVALIVLVVLTATSWAIAHVELAGFGTPVAIAIAAVKASVVGVAFMELPRASLPARVIAFVTIAFIALLCAGTVTDIVLR
jgi:caa(3)-type oxidase subunit IV